MTAPESEDRGRITRHPAVVLIRLSTGKDRNVFVA